MGTVTAIGEYDPKRQPWGYNASATSVTSLTYISGTRASIRFDSWKVAIGAAMVAARSSQNVRVNKVGAEWVVSWDAPVLINPTPTYPSQPGWWQYPWTVTWSGSDTA